MGAMDRGRTGRYPNQHNPKAQVVSGSALAASALADFTRDFSSGMTHHQATLPSSGQATGAIPNSLVDPRSLSYENTDIDSILMRQLNEDIVAYQYDLEFCKNQLAQHDVTPQEARTLQLRVLDLGHQIRHAQHRIETLQLSKGSGGSNMSRPSATASGVVARSAAAASGTGYNMKRTGRVAKHPLPDGSGSASKRSRNDTPSESLDGQDDDSGTMDTTAVQRLGMWKCRLCTSQKYKLAGEGRLPSAPCKWPLRDIAKMMTHYFDLHTEHEPAERCMELGEALEKNRGPFEYWLRRTRSQKVGDGAVIDEVIQQLQMGNVPNILRNLSRAAAEFPST